MLDQPFPDAVAEASTGHFLPSMGPTGAYFYTGDHRSVGHTATAGLPGLRFSHDARKDSPVDAANCKGGPPTPSPTSQFHGSGHLLSHAGGPGGGGPQQHDSLSGESVADTTSPPASVECVVCGDKSSGKHYGQYTCEGCKSFFKRSVRRNLSYSCRGSRSCPVDLQHRNQCQYCRFQKCVKLGMRREAVQKGRVPPNSLLVYPQHLACSLPGWPNQEPTGHASIHGVTVIPGYSLAPFVSSLVKADELFASQFAGGPRSEALGDQWRPLLAAIIEWARKTPYFSDLPLSDQVALLRNCWHDLFLLSALQVSLPVPVAQMVSVCLPSDTSAVNVMNQLADHSCVLQAQVERLKKLRLDATEFAALKALILFNPDTFGVSSTGQIEGVQEKIQCALEEYTRLHHPNQGPRFGRILLRIPNLSRASAQIIEQLTLMQLVNRDSVDTLIHGFLLRSANSLPPGFPSTATVQTGLPGAATTVPGGGAAVLTPQLPSPCLPGGTTPMPNVPMHHPVTSAGPGPVHSHHGHVPVSAAGPGPGGLWLEAVPMTLGMSVGGVATPTSIMSSHHQQAM